MTNDITRWEPGLERLAKMTACLALLLGCFALVVLWQREARVEERNAGLQSELIRTSADIDQLNERMKRKQEQVGQVTADISQQLEKEKSLRLAQYEVLARARALMEEQARFNQVKDDVGASFRKMDDEYMRTKQTALAGQLQSP